MDKMGAAIPADPSYDGWYRTRDLGIDMGNAQYKIIGRIDYCINRNGFLIPLQEIEGRLSSILPELDQVIAVVGDGSTMSGATLIAIGELVKGQRLDGETARKACMSKMPRHLVPDEFYFIQKMPRLGNGKPDRSNLSKNYKLIIIQSANQDGGNHGEGNH
jgi:acyl-CoA synthetase (AMP-forming)/AMP-acid ligase II